VNITVRYKDGTETAATLDEFVALDKTGLNQFRQIGPDSNKIFEEWTDAKQADYEAKQAGQAAASARAALETQAAAALAGYQIKGKTVPLDFARIADWKDLAEEAAAGLFDDLYPMHLPVPNTPAGTVVVTMDSAAEILTTYAAAKARFLSVQAQLGAQLAALEA